MGQDGAFKQSSALLVSKVPHDHVPSPGWLTAPADHRMEKDREKDPGSCPDDFLMRQPFVKVNGISRPTET